MKRKKKKLCSAVGFTLQPLAMLLNFIYFKPWGKDNENRNFKSELLFLGQTETFLAPARRLLLLVLCLTRGPSVVFSAVTQSSLLLLLPTSLDSLEGI